MLALHHGLCGHWLRCVTFNVHSIGLAALAVAEVTEQACDCAVKHHKRVLKRCPVLVSDRDLVVDQLQIQNLLLSNFAIELQSFYLLWHITKVDRIALLAVVHELLDAHKNVNIVKLLLTAVKWRILFGLVACNFEYVSRVIVGCQYLLNYLLQADWALPLLLEKRFLSSDFMCFILRLSWQAISAILSHWSLAKVVRGK